MISRIILIAIHLVPTTLTSATQRSIKKSEIRDEVKRGRAKERVERATAALPQKQELTERAQRRWRRAAPVTTDAPQKFPERILAKLAPAAPPPPLVNFGASCYFNSTLQCLMQLPLFNQFMLTQIKKAPQPAWLEERTFRERAQRYQMRRDWRDRTSRRYQSILHDLEEHKEAIKSLPEDPEKTAKELAFAQYKSNLQDELERAQSEAQRTKENFEAYERLFNPEQRYIFTGNYAQLLFMAHQLPPIPTATEAYENAIEPRRFFDAVGWSIFNSTGQQDAQEFLVSFLDKSTADPTIANPFRIGIKARIRKLVGSEPPLLRTREFEDMLSIGLFGCDRLEQCLANDFTEELIENYEFDDKHREDIKQQRLLASLPPILIIQLKRFMFGGDAADKIYRNIPFPLDDLDVRPYCIDTIAGTTHYRLMGIVQQSGSLHGGHYTSYVRHGDWWYFCDDAPIRIVPVSHDFMEQFAACGLDGRSFTPYLLFYLRADQKQPLVRATTTLVYFYNEQKTKLYIMPLNTFDRCGGMAPLLALTNADISPEVPLKLAFSDDLKNIVLDSGEKISIKTNLHDLAALMETYRNKISRIDVVQALPDTFNVWEWDEENRVHRLVNTVPISRFGDIQPINLMPPMPVQRFRAFFDQKMRSIIWSVKS